MKKILIVDDSVDMRRLLNVTLNREFEIMEASDGEAAIAVVKSQKPDAVLLDVMMPGKLDGLQVLEAIKKDPSCTQTLVCMVTARWHPADRVKGRELGADAYFVKPFSPLRVMRWLNQRLDPAGTHPDALTAGFSPWQ